MSGGVTRERQGGIQAFRWRCLRCYQAEAMARHDGLRRFASSLLDRLVLDDAHAGTDHSLSDLRRSVTRDLENLLNTRREWLGEISDDLPEVARSLTAYGLPDFTNRDLGVDDDRRFVERTIQQVIEIFEPRLERIVVSVDDARSVKISRSVHFRIDAHLRVDPQPEPVVFDAVLELQSKQYEVRGDQ